MSDKKSWNILIHAFDDKEKFLAARVFRAECDFHELDRLVQVLSFAQGLHDGSGGPTDEYYRTSDRVIWKHLVYIRQYFTTCSNSLITLRVVHFSENQN